MPIANWYTNVIWTCTWNFSSCLVCILNFLIKHKNIWMFIWPKATREIWEAVRGREEASLLKCEASVVPPDTGVIPGTWVVGQNYNWFEDFIAVQTGYLSRLAYISAWTCVIISAALAVYTGAGWLPTHLYPLSLFPVSIWLVLQRAVCHKVVLS